MIFGLNRPGIEPGTSQTLSDGLPLGAGHYLDQRRNLIFIIATPSKTFIDLESFNFRFCFRDKLKNDIKV